ncbi:MAG: hypothetical protein ABH983_01230 [Candidatus Micrarchaeota archaeon]
MQKTQGRRIILPPPVRELQKPFFSKKIDPDLERLMRFNGTVHRYDDGPPIARHYLSGGAGTIMGEPVSEAYAAEFDALSEIIYLRRFDRTDKKFLRDTITAQCQLHGLLNQRGVTLTGGGTNPNSLPKLHSSTYNLMLEVLLILPDNHFSHEHFSKLILGGWGSGAAKCSQYLDLDVHLYDFILKGARRNLIATFLHEIGHSFFETLSLEQKQVLHNFRNMLVKQSNSNIFGVASPELVLAADYLYGPESRIPYSLGSTNEFVAESYMLYVTQGAFTPEGNAQRQKLDGGSETSAFTSFVSSVPPKLAKAYTALWKFFREEFEGIEYI